MTLQETNPALARPSWVDAFAEIGEPWPEEDDAEDDESYPHGGQASDPISAPSPRAA